MGILLLPWQAEEDRRASAEEFCDRQRTFDCDLDHPSLHFREFVDEEGKVRDHCETTADVLLEPDIQTGSKFADIGLEENSGIAEKRNARMRSFRELRSRVRNLGHTCAHYLVRECARIHKQDAKRQYGDRWRARLNRKLRGEERKEQNNKKALCKKKRCRKTILKHKDANRAGSVVTQYSNLKSKAHKLAHGTTSRAEYEKLQRQWKAELAELEPQEQVVLASHVGPIASLCQAAASQLKSDSNSKVPVPDDPDTVRIGHFRRGTLRYPVAPDSVGTHVVACGAAPCQSPGKPLWEAGSQVFIEAALQLEGVPSSLPLLPAERKRIHKSCDDMHFGFCENAAMTAKCQYVVWSLT